MKYLAFFSFLLLYFVCFCYYFYQNHSVYLNSANKKTSTLPRHNEINDFLVKDIDEYGVIKLSEKGKKFLENPWSIELLKYVDPGELERRQEEMKLEEMSTFDEVLLGILKKMRKQIDVLDWVSTFDFTREGSESRLDLRR